MSSSSILMDVVLACFVAGVSSAASASHFLLTLEAPRQGAVGRAIPPEVIPA